MPLASQPTVRELSVIVAGQAQCRLRLIVGAEAEEFRLGCNLIRRNCRAWNFDSSCRSCSADRFLLPNRRVQSPTSEDPPCLNQFNPIQT